MADAAIPVVAVVGRPNVGKSSLVNRVLGRRVAIVEEQPGVTRDRRAYVADWGGRSFEIVDTGGLEPGQRGLEAQVADQARFAIEAADVVVLVVDVNAGIMEDDRAVAELLRASDKPALVAANKVDDASDEPSAAEFHALGLDEVVAVSALHGRASGDLLDAIVSRLPERDARPTDEWASIAIVGRPNVGKSSMLNALVGEERALVDATPGTTRDPVDSILELSEGKALRIVDTAGMRRRTHVDDPIEYFSYLRARRTLERVDAVLLMMDASEGVTGPDQRIAEAIVTAGRACVLALNKWDLAPGEETDRKRLEDAIEDRLRFLPWATRLRTAVPRRRGIERVVPALEAAIESHRRRLPTALLNRVLQDAQQARPHPRTGGKAIRIRYAAQVEASPPRILVFSTGSLEESYRRYLERKIRQEEPFAGSPVVLERRSSKRQPLR